MLDSVKIDRETTAQSGNISKRMRRKELEIFERLQAEGGGRHRENIAQLDEEIARIEGDMLFAEIKERNARAYTDSKAGTVRAQSVFVAPMSSNVFYRSSSRAAAGRVPATIQVRIDDILLERAPQSAVAGGGGGASLRTRRSYSSASGSAAAAAAGRDAEEGTSSLGRSSTQKHATLPKRRAATSLGGEAPSFSSSFAATNNTPSQIRGTNTRNNSLHNTSVLSAASNSSANAYSYAFANPPLPSIDGRSPYRNRGSLAAASGGGGGGLFEGTIGGGRAAGGQTTAATSQAPPAPAAAARRRSSESSTNKALQQHGWRPTTDGWADAASSAFMHSVGRLRASSPAAMQHRLLGLTASSNASAGKGVKGGGGSKKGLSTSTAGGGGGASFAMTTAASAAALSEELLGRTRIDGQPIPDTDSDEEVSHPNTKLEGGAPPVAVVNELPWKAPLSHSVLIRDPYLRRHGLHRHDTYLYSHKMREGLRGGGGSGGGVLRGVVERDGCDFNYRGNIRGEGMQRGNVTK